MQVSPGGNHPQLAVPNTELQGVSAQPSDPVHASRSEAGDPDEQEPAATPRLRPRRHDAGAPGAQRATYGHPVIFPPSHTVAAKDTTALGLSSGG